MLFLAQVVLAEQPTPILPDPKLTPGDTFDVTAQDVCVPGYARVSVEREKNALKLKHCLEVAPRNTPKA